MLQHRRSEQVSAPGFSCGVLFHFPVPFLAWQFLVFELFLPFSTSIRTLTERTQFLRRPNQIENRSIVTRVKLLLREAAVLSGNTAGESLRRPRPLAFLRARRPDGLVHKYHRCSMC